MVVFNCEGGWCQVDGEGFDGWLDQIRLFGVYFDEIIEDGKMLNK